MNNEKDKNITPSKNFIMPFILLLLSRMTLHGYDLIQKLQAFGFQTLDQGNLYRLLRQLEKENLVQSEWDTKGSGPAKRCYSITEAGKAYLTSNARQLELYQSMLDQFFKMYTSFLELYIPPFQREDKIEKNSNPKEEEEV
ncbi:MULTISPECIES: poly-beta-hydroxybutyrate-responsive repressor [Bacillaceae]|jgi:poly-beta-hydroxybutyrate-responsive repressor|uniref:Poly-beta-hydroxybutyrate-responsive repressor n=1 Tax=Gottfriedia luciferensis TaxID=178774 RepID=A0ABX2ZZ76_9BACI|nr:MULTISPECIES: poly-beta-hydroxybutyrate-responsive repressor [Bacillaceae]ODG93852.1 poly-beta-hydroxybutyrate-responsive repressor [Gottfriedia luciferensis]PGZ85056.1 poly-beta-hydroxybutyrate-responsive repressor [Bacillus sp. AFS029533]SFC30084.1 poly-beta-hydroxybutyrate-responsive repressor [Bacillus sp. UNCCL81]